MGGGGGGGVCEGYGNYSLEYPPSITACKFSISSLECFNVILVVRVWAGCWSGRHNLLFCDNAATVNARTSSMAQDPLIRAALRECWWLTAVNDIQLVVRHQPGANMETPDLFSRAGTSRRFAEKFHTFESSTCERRAMVTTAHLNCRYWGFRPVPGFYNFVLFQMYL